ncbi:hypothetical protein [Endozoicomonas acroporae]|uniref:hypothetical protein n=1 Tax=Endozoicomonas acroporae TaxID=1701104 RepID=UPI003D7B317B
MKTAFITSLAGMLLSIVYKGLGAYSALNKKREDQGIDTDEVSAGDLYSVMSNQAETLEKIEQFLCKEDNGSLSELQALVKQQTTGLENLQKAIGGDNESSLVGQFKLMRSDINDNQRRLEKHLELSAQALTGIHSLGQNQQDNFKAFEERLWLKLQDFADMMSKSATEQVIEALKSVIQDFNNNLTEQFGENFKQLNDAVLELVTWQENYKQQLTEMKLQYDYGVQAISQTETSVAYIGEKAQSIPVAMDTLVKVMEVNQHQIEELSRHLNAFEQVRDKAVEAVPEIRHQIDQAIAGAREANETMAKGVIDSADKLKIVVMESADNYRDTVDRTRGALDDAATTTANSSLEIKEQFRSTIEDINNNLRNLVGELQTGGKALNESYKEANSKLVADLNKAAEAMNSGVEAAGQQLVSQLQQGGKTINEAYQNAGELLISEFKQSNQELKGLNSELVRDLREGNQSINASFIEATKEVGDNTSRIVSSFGSSIEDMQQSLASTIKQHAEEHRQQADRVFAGLERSIEHALNNTGESVQKQVQMIDRTMESEVTKVMQSMGDALGSISGQFTRDYSRLTQEMSKVVNQRHIA